MSDPAALIALASTGTIAVAMTSVAALRGWEDWLELRRQQLGAGKPPAGSAPGARRLDLADSRDRVRRLEAIANGSET